MEIITNLNKVLCTKRLPTPGFEPGTSCMWSQCATVLPRLLVVIISQKLGLYNHMWPLFLSEINNSLTNPFSTLVEWDWKSIFQEVNCYEGALVTRYRKFIGSATNLGLHAIFSARKRMESAEFYRTNTKQQKLLHRSLFKRMKQLDRSGVPIFLKKIVRFSRLIHILYNFSWRFQNCNFF